MTQLQELMKPQLVLDWLKSHAPNEEVGDPSCSCDCPLWHYLNEKADGNYWLSPEGVSEYHLLCGKPLLLVFIHDTAVFSDFQSDMMRYAETENREEIRAFEAIEILENCMGL